MIDTKWIQPAAFGAVAGAAALAIVGFGWGGWMTAGSAETMAGDRAEEQVVLALSPVCFAKYRADPMGGQTLTELKAAQSYQRRQIVMDAGYATPPGADGPDRDLAAACAERIMEGS
ncbi:hypothetical protein P2H44_22365 [Albimonas sp. CAU 1670]|uniref:hypothetical protein n=1 Tax=Albimonas sp. CAU 1670 TaxID=3032599 RepID=UPI0023DA5D84|nr:hypothetical protein [Albimonas sp. CAU 1670]MDF2235312.1 hypothetical protein [Albimonas sp. CAU 1670]